MNSNIKKSLKGKKINLDDNKDLKNFSITKELNEKIENISQILDKASNKEDLSEEESKDILLSLDLRKSKESNL